MRKGARGSSSGRGADSDVNWLQCDDCNRYELYENCGFEGEYDQKKVDTLKFVCKWCGMDEWKSGVNARLSELSDWKNGVNARLYEFQEWKDSMNERVTGLVTELKDVRECVEKVEKRMDVVREDSVKVMNDACMSVNTRQIETVERVDVIGASVSEVRERVGKLGDKLGAVEGSLAEMGVRQLGLEDLLEGKEGVKELYSAVLSKNKLKENKKKLQAEQHAASSHSAPTAAVAVVDAVGAVDGTVPTDGASADAQPSDMPSFAEQCAAYKAGTVLLVGSSLARGVGQHLEAQNPMFDKLDFSGSRIEDIREKFAVLGDRPDCNIVVMVGTNNLERDRPDVMMKKYGELIDELKSHQYRAVSIVALLRRGDWKLDGTIAAVNRRLKALCENRGIGFVEAQVDRNRMLAGDGIHLNWRGCECVARAIFKHSCRSLNLC
jgi:hypothetical protein